MHRNCSGYILSLRLLQVIGTLLKQLTTMLQVYFISVYSQPSSAYENMATHRSSQFPASSFFWITASLSETHTVSMVLSKVNHTTLYIPRKPAPTQQQTTTTLGSLPTDRLPSQESQKGVRIVGRETPIEPTSERNGNDEEKTMMDNKS